MPINKNALLRYRILDSCFSDYHHYYDIEELVDKVNEAFIDMYGKTVSLRQIRADISYMKDRVSYNGRADVERWIKSGKLKPSRISPGKKRYKLIDLQKLANIQQNYLL